MSKRYYVCGETINKIINSRKEYKIVALVVLLFIAVILRGEVINPNNNLKTGEKK